MTAPLLTLLALDPGTSNFGFGVLEVHLRKRGPRPVSIKLKEHGLILSTMRNLTVPRVLHEQRKMFEAELDDLIESHKVTHIIMERYMLRRGAGGTTIECVNQMIGLILARNLPSRMIPASQWKNNVHRQGGDLETLYAALKEHRITPHQCDACHIGYFGAYELLKKRGMLPEQVHVPIEHLIDAPAFHRGISTLVKKPKKRKRIARKA